MVGPSGLEPPTSRLSGVRSNQLSYGPTGRASMGGLAGGQCHSLPHPELPETHCVLETQEAAAARHPPEGWILPASRLQLLAPEREIRIAHGLENPEVDLRD